MKWLPKVMYLDWVYGRPFTIIFTETVSPLQKETYSNLQVSTDLFSPSLLQQLCPSFNNLLKINSLHATNPAKNILFMPLSINRYQTKSSTSNKLCQQCQGRAFDIIRMLVDQRRNKIMVQHHRLTFVYGPHLF